MNDDIQKPNRSDEPSQNGESTPSSSNSRIDSLVFLAEIILALVAFSIITWIGLVYTGEAKNAESILEALTPHHISHLVFVNLFLGLLLYLIRFPFAWLETRLGAMVEGKLNNGSNGNSPISQKSSEAFKGLVELVVSVTQVGAYFFLIVFYIPFACGFYPKAKPIGDAILEYLMEPLSAIFHSILYSLPDLFAIAVYIIIASYVLRFMRLFAEATSEGQIKFSWLAADSVMPIYQILRIFVLVFTFVAIFRRLPGADNTEFKFIAGFFALLATLSSSSAVGNFIAGLMMTFMRLFRKGDRVRIGEIEGDILDHTLLVTRIVTPKNERISIPNLQVLSGEIVNYSAYASARGVGISVFVTIGYDVPFRQVQDLLLEAAAATKDVLEQPEPYVHQSALGDFSVTYELVCFTKRPRQMPRVRSDIQSQILSAFEKKEVEILSPVYHAVRDGNSLAIPRKAELKRDDHPPPDKVLA